MKHCTSSKFHSTPIWPFLQVSTTLTRLRTRSGWSWVSVNRKDAKTSDYVDEASGKARFYSLWIHTYFCCDKRRSRSFRNLRNISTLLLICLFPVLQCAPAPPHTQAGRRPSKSPPNPVFTWWRDTFVWYLALNVSERVWLFPIVFVLIAPWMWFWNPLVFTF